MSRVLRPFARRGGAIVAGAAAFALLLTGCAGQVGSGGGAAKTPHEWEMTTATAAPSGQIDSINWAIYAEPYSLDYAYAFDYADNQVLANMCESLLRLNPDFSLSPGLAKSVDNPDPLTWVYHIRDGVTFHDGTPLTGADAAASMNRHIDEEVGSFWYSVYQNVASIEQTGEMEVTVTTVVPDSQFNQLMSGAAGVIESAATLAELGADYGNSTGGVNCTGPFKFENWKAGESITMSAYDGYWDESLRAKAGEFKFVVINDAAARVNALKSGEVDGTWLLPLDAVEQLRASGAGDVLFGLNTTVSNLVISNLDGPLGDKRVRQALLMALDRENILMATSGGIGEVTDVFTTPSVWADAGAANEATAFADIRTYDYDLEAAKELVEEAGATGQKITLVTAPMGQDFAVTSQATVAAAKAIGLDATIQTVTPNAYTALFSDPSAREGVDLFYTAWYLSSPDPLEMYGVLRTDEFSNYGNWSNAEFDGYVTEALSTMDPIERGAITAKVQQLANEELPWLPLYAGPTAMFMGNNVTGVHPSIAFMYYPWAAELGAR